MSPGSVSAAAGGSSICVPASAVAAAAWVFTRLPIAVPLIVCTSVMRTRASPSVPLPALPTSVMRPLGPICSINRSTSSDRLRIVAVAISCLPSPSTGRTTIQASFPAVAVPSSVR